MVHVSRTDDEERGGSLSRETLGSLRDGTMWEGEKDQNKGHIDNQETWKAVVEYKKTLLWASFVALSAIMWGYDVLVSLVHVVANTRPCSSWRSN